MTDPFTTGDTVALRSGGTAMTVDAIGPEWVRCTWMDESGQERAASFSPRCLARVLLCEVEAEAAMFRTIWVFADSGLPTVSHVLTAVRLSRPVEILPL